MPKNNDEPIIMSVTVDGLELPPELFQVGSPDNENLADWVAEVLDEAEAAEEPDFILSTAAITDSWTDHTSD